LPQQATQELPLRQLQAIGSSGRSAPDQSLQNRFQWDLMGFDALCIYIFSWGFKIVQKRTWQKMKY